jgi:hypothetical protein
MPTTAVALRRTAIPPSAASKLRDGPGAGSALGKSILCPVVTCTSAGRIGKLVGRGGETGLLAMTAGVGVAGAAVDVTGAAVDCAV